MKSLITILLFFLPLGVLADGEWKGEGDLGYNKATGNTQTEALLSKLKLTYDIDRWSHTGQLEAVNSSDSGDRTAESYTGKLATNYAISEKYYAFGKGRYEENRFSGYEYQASVAPGLGVHFIDTESTVFNLEAGVGFRRSKEQDTGATSDEAIFQLATKFYRQLTETTRFESDLGVESGADNTYSEAIFALKVKINSHLALKLGYMIKNNSDVPVDTDKTDTLTSVGLNYSF